MTTHEHWLVCPMHVLWSHQRRVCETTDCVRCCIKGRKPPQFWRKTDLMDRSIGHLDALICPSRSTQVEHARRGVKFPTTHLPYFLPEDYTGMADAETPDHHRPYIAAAGRLEEIKGFQDAIDAARRLPSIDLRIAGSGQFEGALRARAEGLSNVHFEGRLDSADLAAFFRGARAVVVPSLVFETFGYVVLEAFAESTPVVVRDLGALPELVAESGGGLIFDSHETLVESLDRITQDDILRDELGRNGRASRNGIWSEEEHLKRYFDIIEGCRMRKASISARRDRSGHRAFSAIPT